jgi:transmembrane sensor
MKMWNTVPFDKQRALEEAAQWCVRLAQEADLELSPEFHSWITKSGNDEAFQAVQAGWRAMDELGASTELLGFRGRTLRRAQWIKSVRWLPRRALARAAAVLLFISVAGGGGLYLYASAPTHYETGIGVRRMVALPDGSRISLDSSSTVRVRYTDGMRRIELERGRARFDVAHDTARPFAVRAGMETVVAVGTSFSVERLGAKVLVTLFQGRVVVENATASSSEQRPSPISLDAGQEFVASRGGDPEIRTVDLQTASAWEAGQLVFKEVTLEEAAAQENRYTDKPIIVEPSAASIRISGVFSAGDVVSFVSAVTNYLPVQATTNAADRIVLRHRP